MVLWGYLETSILPLQESQIYSWPLPFYFDPTPRSSRELNSFVNNRVNIPVLSLVFVLFFKHKFFNCCCRFPFTKERQLKKWIKNIGRPNFAPSYDDVVCSEHFRKTDFWGRMASGRRNLKPGAVPTIFNTSGRSKRLNTAKVFCFILLFPPLLKFILFFLTILDRKIRAWSVPSFDI